MKKLFTILALSLFVLSCQKNIDPNQETGQIQEQYYIPAGYTVPGCVTPVETPLLAGQTIDVGSVTVWNDETNVYVHYQATGNYKLKKTHLYVGACSGIPTNNSGNPRIGQFPYQTTHGTTGVQQFTYTIPKSSLPGGCLCVAAHAEIVAYNASGQIIFSQTAWGQGQQITDGGSWAMKFDYCQQDCEGPR
ncbi:MAG: hypothetical protein ACT4OJ_01530 [Bacteroidota bacterium]